MTKCYDTGSEIIEIRSEDVIADTWLEQMKKESSQKDFMTGYYNRDTFVNIVDSKDKESKAKCALLVFEIDGFMTVSDALGRFQADGLLMRTAIMIGDRYPDICMGRLCMDLFGIYIQNCESTQEAMNIAKKLCSEIVIMRKMIRCTLTIGVSVREAKDSGFDRMYNEAYQAVFSARRLGRGKCVLYDDISVDEKGVKYSQDYVNSYFPSEGIIMEDYQDPIYIVDPVSYELLYINKAIKQACKIDNSYLGKRCYEVLAGRDKPCEGCTKDILGEVNNFFWTLDFPNDGRRLIVKDSIKEWHGRRVKFVQSINVSDKDRIQNVVARSFDMQYTLKMCIDQVITSDNMQYSFANVLKFTGQYYNAERASLYETDGLYTVTDVHEWDSIGHRIINNSTLLDLSVLLENDKVKQCTNEEGVTYIKDIGILLESDKDLYDMLHSKGILSMMLMKLEKNSQIKGYIIMFNPANHLSEVTILMTMSTYIANELVRQQLWNQRTYEMTHDTMTGSYNRISYVEFINEIKEAESLGYMVANINGLRDVNENIGYEYGDDIIKQVAEILKDVFVGYPVFRFEGDEFTACCVDIPRDEFVDLVTNAKVQLAKNECGVAIGFVWDDFEIDVKKMNEHAEQLMRIEKRKMYEQKNLYIENSHDKIASGIINHINNENFKVYLQPKFNINDGSYCGAEALIRLEHPDYGLLSPVKFIPILEKTGTIHHVDLFVFEKVCQMLEQMNKKGIKLFPISFNFSKMTLLENDLIEKVEQTALKYDVPRKYLEIEITETIGDMENDIVTRIANDLHEKGFRLSMDDFGTKYSSISILSLMRFDILKIDRSMVSNLTDNDISRKVIKHIIAMCNDLGIECIAEGVETPEQAKILQEVDCNIAQGYLYGKPTPAQEFENKYIWRNTQDVKN